MTAPEPTSGAAPEAMTDADLARALGLALRARGALPPDVAAAAAAHLQAGALPTTALLRAGADRAALLEALAHVTGLAARPDPSTWQPAARAGVRVTEAAWRGVCAIPVAGPAPLVVAFADPKRVAAVRAKLPAHTAVVCFEDEVEQAFAAAPVVGAGGDGDDIAGHIRAGGFQGGGTVAPVEVPAVRPAAEPLPSHYPTPRAPPPEEKPDPSAWIRPALKIAGIAVAALIALKIGGSVMGSLLAEKPKGNAPPLGSVQQAFKEGRYDETEALATALLASEPSHGTQANALLLRGRARLATGHALTAVADLSKIIDSLRDTEFVPEARLRRGLAYVAAGDKDSALLDFEPATRPGVQQPLRVEAYLERGLIRAERGQVAEARADLERAESFTAPADPLHQRARAALAQLGGAP